MHLEKRILLNCRKLVTKRALNNLALSNQLIFKIKRSFLNNRMGNLLTNWLSTMDFLKIGSVDGKMNNREKWLENASIIIGFLLLKIILNSK
jgi:hypothetical protein